jgi:hypothetical protein
MAAASWAIAKAVPFKMFASASFRRMCQPLNKDASKIINVGHIRVQEQVMKLGRYAEEATLMELQGHKLSLTNGHWAGPNDKTYTTVTAHYISADWQMQSACLDFKVFEGSTTGERIYADIKAVLAKFKGETVMMMEDTISITDTTGNMGVLGRFLCENGHKHAYCTDHNFHLNAKFAFDRK